jgi:hypothetical protein
MVHVSNREAQGSTKNEIGVYTKRIRKGIGCDIKLDILTQDSYETNVPSVYKGYVF